MMPWVQERDNLAALAAAEKGEGMAMPRGMVGKFKEDTKRQGEIDWVTERQEVAEAMEKAEGRPTGAGGKGVHARGGEQEDKMARAMTYLIGAGPGGASAIGRISCTRTAGDGMQASWFTYGGLVRDMESHLSMGDQERIGSVAGLKGALIRLGQRGFVTLYSDRILIAHN